MQEVQTAINTTPITTLETIEWVGTSSEKIREWRQTTPKESYSSIISWSASASTRPGETVDISIKNWTIDIQWKDIYFEQVSWGIRIPEAGAYIIKVYMRWGASAFVDEHRLKINWKVKFSWTSQTQTKENWLKFEEIINLWKYAMIAHECDFTYIGSSSGASWQALCEIQLTKL